MNKDINLQPLTVYTKKNGEYYIYSREQNRIIKISQQEAELYIQRGYVEEFFADLIANTL